MKHWIYILIFLTFAPFILNAAERKETMVERRARIMRKYLHTKAKIDVDAGTFLMPTRTVSEEEKDDVISSGEYKKKTNRFKKQEGMNLPIRRRVPLRSRPRPISPISMQEVNGQGSMFEEDKDKKRSSYDQSRMYDNTDPSRSTKTFSSKEKSLESFFYPSEQRSKKYASGFGQATSPRGSGFSDRGKSKEGLSSFFGVKTPSSFSGSEKASALLGGKRNNFLNSNSSTTSRSKGWTGSSYSSRKKTDFSGSGSMYNKKKQNSSFNTNSRNPSAYKSVLNTKPTTTFSTKKDRFRRENQPKKLSSFEKWKKKNPAPNPRDPNNIFNRR